MGFSFILQIDLHAYCDKAYESFALGTSWEYHVCPSAYSLLQVKLEVLKIVYCAQTSIGSTCITKHSIYLIGI
jgi:hypothetical protein